jgi:hypothetical protein
MEEYTDERFCENCDTYTSQICRDSGHERDSSGDYEECLVCRWYKSGLTNKRSKPFDIY